MSLDPEKYYREFHRRRIASGTKSNYNQSVCEIDFFLSFGLTPTIDNLHLVNNGLFLSGSVNEKTFVILSEIDETIQVDPNLKYDIYVFCGKIDEENYGILGWITGAELKEAPLKDGTLRLTTNHLFQFDGKFKSPCDKSLCDAESIWDWDEDSWSCFRCGKFRYDSEGREWYTTYLSKQSDKNKEDSKESVS